MASLQDLHELDVPAEPGGYGTLGIAFDRDGVRVADSGGSVRHAAHATVESAVALAEQALSDAGIEPVSGAVVALPRGDEHLGEALGDRLGMPVQVDTHANLGALGELVAGAARGLRDVVYVDASWSIGAGLVLDGRLYGGASGLAGELGHVQVDPRGSVCDCGNRGCLWTVASAGALLERLRVTITPRLSLPGLQLLVAEGHPAALEAIDDAGRTIGRALGPVCEALNPAAVVVGGALAGPALVAGVRVALGRHARVASAAMTVAQGALGERAPLLGALSRVAGPLAG